MAESRCLPDFLTIDEAARVLRLGRTAAYEQARVWRDTDGRAGLPNFMIGHALRVPTEALEKMLGRSLSAIPAPRRREVSPKTTVADPPAEGQVRELRPRVGVRRRPPAAGTQGALPL